MKKILFSTKVYLLNSTLLLLRVATAIFIGTHGWSKIVHFSDYLNRFADPLGFGPAVSLQLAIFAEFFCAILLALGFLTRLALVPLILTMTTVIFSVHGADSWGDVELPALYLVSFIALFITGPGKYSMDSQIVTINKY